MGYDPKMFSESARRQILAKLQGKQYKPPKYHNEKASRKMPNGEIRTFDSQREARRYDQLMLLLKAGQIKDLRLQQTFTLQESYVTSEGEVVRGIVYKADFVYISLEQLRDIFTLEEAIKNPEFLFATENKSDFVWPEEVGRLGHKIFLSNGKPYYEKKNVEDAKGVKTDSYKIKKKLMHDKLGITVQEV